MKNADDVVRADLDFIATTGAGAELAQMSGRRLMIAGGAGFLGYYLVQGALNWNRVNAGKAPIKVLVLDNFIRGGLARRPGLHHPRGLDCFAYLLPQVPHRNDGRQHQRSALHA